MSTARLVADAFERYAALVTAQVAALDRDEIERVGMLALQRQQLAEEIDGLGIDYADPAGLSEVRRAMAHCSEADQQLRRRLEELNQENVDGTRRIDRWRKALTVYSSEQTGSVAIDVKF